MNYKIIYTISLGLILATKPLDAHIDNSQSEILSNPLHLVPLPQVNLIPVVTQEEIPIGLQTPRKNRVNAGPMRRADAQRLQRGFRYAKRSIAKESTSDQITQ